ncbi:MAG TPA: hypothetical protein VF846_07715 [Thermoanaerobaculia bacterium]|jgi:hypothetical protein
MKIISNVECQSWIVGKPHSSFTWESIEIRHKHVMRYSMPADAGRKTALARTFSALSDGPGEGLLWITRWGIFPSSENMTLFEGYRRSLNEKRTLASAPGHLFGAADIEQLECLLGMALYFFWDVSLFAPNGVWVRISHDEVFSVHSTDRAELRTWQEALAPFELELFSAVEQ